MEEWGGWRGSRRVEAGQDGVGWGGWRESRRGGARLSVEEWGGWRGSRRRDRAEMVRRLARFGPVRVGRDWATDVTAGRGRVGRLARVEPGRAGSGRGGLGRVRRRMRIEAQRGAERVDRYGWNICDSLCLRVDAIGTKSRA